MHLVLQALPSYTMETTFLPKLVCNSLESLTRNFFWKVSGGRSWHTIVLSELFLAKKDRDLGFRNLYYFNRAFIMKLA